MGKYWDHATTLLRVLVWRALGYDEDGMGKQTPPPTSFKDVQTPYAILT